MESILGPIVDLVRLGNLGVGVAIILLIVWLASRPEPIDERTAKLRGDVVRFGFAYAIVTALMTLVPLFIGGGPHSLRLAFSPDFDREKLEAPTIRLPDGTQAQHDAKFDLPPGTGTQVVTIAMDGTLDQVRNLREATAALTTTVANMTTQRNALAQQAVAAGTPDAATAAPALQDLRDNSLQSLAIQSDFIKSVQAGDYAKASQLTAHLQTSVEAAQPSIAAIARQPR